MSRKTYDIDSDPRVTHVKTELNGKRYHYLLAVPENGEFHNTIILVRRLFSSIHGSLDCVIRLLFNAFRDLAVLYVRGREQDSHCWKRLNETMTRSDEQIENTCQILPNSCKNGELISE